MQRASGKRTLPRTAVAMPTGMPSASRSGPCSIWSSRKDVTRLGVEQGCDGFARSRVSQLPDVMPQRLSAVGSDEIADLIQCRQAEHEPASEICRAEPGTLLAPHGHDPKGPGATDRVGIRRSEHGKACRDAGEAVVVAAVRHRIEMRSGRDAGRRRIDPGQQDLDVSKRVVQDLQAMPPRKGADAVRGHLVVSAPGSARDAGAVRRLMPDPLQELPDFA